MVDSTTPKLSIKLQGDLQRNPDVTIGAYKPEPVAALPVPKPDDADLGTPVNPNVSTPVLDIQPDSGVTKMQSFGAGFAPVGRDLYQAISEKMHFEPEEGYDPQADYDEFVQTYSINNPEEIKSLLTATSKGAFDNRALRIQEKRDRDVKINANPWSAVTGSILDIDIPVAIASGFAGATVKASVAAQRVVSASIAGATIGTAMGVAGDAQMTSDAERIGVVAAGVLGGATAIVRPRKPSTTPSTPPSPNSTVSTPTILPDEVGVSQGIPKPVLPAGTVISPLPTSTTNKTIPPNLSGLQYDAVTGSTVSVRTLLDEVTAEITAMGTTTYAVKEARINELVAGVGKVTRVPPKAEDTVSGGVSAVHGSKVKNLKFTPNWNATDNIEDKSYFDNVFGDDVAYIAEDIAWTPRTPEEAAAMRMPFYENVYDVDANFNKAFILTPDSAPRLGVLVGDYLSGDELVAKLRSLGYDGLIIRDMPEDYIGVLALSNLSKLAEDVLQNQIVAFKPSSLTVVGEHSGRGLDNTLQSTSSTTGAGVKTSATDATLVETRGTGVRFHGTSTPLPKDMPTNDGVFQTSPSNIYGEGFYTTEAVDIAKGYTGKGKGGAPTLYKVEERGDIPVYDLDQPITPDIQRLVDSTFKGVLDDVAEDYDLSTLSKVFDAVRAESSAVGWSKYDVQDAFFSIRADLEALGYRGLTHIGGAKTGNEAHNVKIYWYPEDDLVVTRSDLADYTVPKTTGVGVKTQYQVPTTSTTATTPISGSGVLKQTQLSQAQLLDDLVEAEIQSLSTPTPSTIVSIPVGSSRINLSSPLQGDGTELKLPKLSVEYHAVAALQSAADEMFYYTKGDPEAAMNRILASPYTQGDDVVTHANAVLRDMEVKLVPFEESIVKATKELHGTTSVFGKLFRKDHNKRLQQTSMDVYSELQKIDQIVVEAAGTGKTLSNAEINALIDATSNTDAIKASMKTYVDSNIAGEMYDHIKRVGLMDDDALEHIVRRPTYVTTKHSYEAQKRFIDADTVSTSGRRLAVANFLGEQITKMYPDLMRGIKGTDGKIINLKTDTIGAKFMDNMKVRSENPNAVRTIGVSKDELYDMLTSQGLDDSAAKALAVKLTQTRSAQQGEKHLRRRIDWDWNKTATAPDGTVFGMRDLVDQNAFHTIVDYNRRMSKRVGLAQYGFKDAQSLQDAKSRIMDNLPEGTNPNKARQYLDNVINGALGNPIGADMPDWVRSMNTIGGSILLSGSGLYNAIELGVQVQRLGLLRSIPHFAAALKPMVRTVGSYSKAEAKTLHDTLVGKMMSTDRWQNIMTHYADDFTIEGGFHESVQYFGQATRFLNGAEYIKRYQIGLFASVFVDAFKGAAKGSPNSIKFLKDGLRFSDELLEKTTQQFNKHGDNIDGWDADVRIAMEQKVFHEGDNLAHVVHHGEIPSFMEYSQVGKIIFPFMRYLFAMQQKILRRTNLRDGTTGVALVLAVQFPLAVMVANTKRAMNGDKPYDMDNPEDVRMFIRSTLTGMSGLGSMTYPIDIMMSGGQNMGSTIALAPIGKMVGLTEGIITGEATARDFKEATPFNTILPVNLLLAALNDEE